MIAALLARFGLTVSAAFVRAALIAGLLALAGLGAWRAMARFDAVLAAADARGHARASAEWRAEIEKSNAAAATARAEQAIAAAAAEARAAGDAARLTETLAEMEKRNAALARPDACGLDAARGRLLDTLR